MDLNALIKDCVFREDINIFIGHLIEITRNLRNSEIKIPSVLNLDPEDKHAINQTFIPQFYVTYYERNEKLVKEI